MQFDLEPRNPLDFLAGCGVIELALRHHSQACFHWEERRLSAYGVSAEEWLEWANTLLQMQPVANPAAHANADDADYPMLLVNDTRKQPLHPWLNAQLSQKSVFAGGIAGQVRMDSVVASNRQAAIGLQEAMAAHPEQSFQLHAPGTKPQITKLDAVTAWSALGAGFSLNETKQNQTLPVRPLAELLALFGAHAFFPQNDPTRGAPLNYHTWNTPLPALLCKAAARGQLPLFPLLCWQSTANRSGKLIGYSYAQPVHKEFDTWTFSN
jgi:hypothetical protein